MHGGAAADGVVVAQHRHQGHDARPAAGEQHRPVFVAVPNEVAADRTAQLDLIADVEVTRQIRRHLAVVDAHHRELELLTAGR